MYQILAGFFGLILSASFSRALPSHAGQQSPTVRSLPIQRRSEPFFPDSPPSCPICAQNYPSINSCARAAPVFANFTQIVFNPGAFIDVIKCACTDTFEAAFPQCVDCFVQTNQTDVLGTPNLPSIVDGMRKVCALESALLGGVATADGEATLTSSSVAASATGSTSSADALHWQSQMYSVGSATAFLAIIGLVI